MFQKQERINYTQKLHAMLDPGLDFRNKKSVRGHH